MLGESLQKGGPVLNGKFLLKAKLELLLHNGQEILITAAGKGGLLVDGGKVDQRPVLLHLGDLRLVLPDSPGRLGQVIQGGGPLDDLGKRLHNCRHEEK